MFQEFCNYFIKAFYTGGQYYDVDSSSDGNGKTYILIVHNSYDILGRNKSTNELFNNNDHIFSEQDTKIP